MNHLDRSSLSLDERKKKNAPEDTHAGEQEKSVVLGAAVRRKNQKTQPLIADIVDAKQRPYLYNYYLAACWFVLIKA